MTPDERQYAYIRTRLHTLPTGMAVWSTPPGPDWLGEFLALRDAALRGDVTRADIEATNG